MHWGIWSRAGALLLAAVLSGCVAQNINPVTGKPIYTRGVTPAIEAAAGKKANDELTASYGVYKEDPALSAYVDRIGQTLVKNTVRKDIRYTFTILNDDEINAYALPGGYVYVTRGALNFANSEAEIAGIIGHEIGHVDAFHFGRSDHDTVKILLSVLLRHSSQSIDDLALAKKLADESARSSDYSQEQELEADALGIHYMALAGYDPEGILVAMRTGDAKTALDDGKMKGNPIAHEMFALDQSHPATPQREAHALEAAKVEAAKVEMMNVEEAKLAAASEPAPGAVAAAAPAGAAPMRNRDAYLAAVDGMTFGEDPVDGTVEGRRLVNAALGFGFEAPPDFDLWVSHGGVFGIGPKAALVIEQTEDYTGQSLAAYVQSSMMDKLSVTDVRPLEIDGWRGATGVAANDPFTIRLAAVHDRGNHLYKLLYVAHRRAFDDLDAGFLASLKSFRGLEGAEAKPRPALRLHVVTVKPGDTVKSLAERMAVKEKKLEWFRVLNGLAAGDDVTPGDKVKLVVE